ncbi:MAG TPA: hypothetical protein VD886_25935 [Herpetosiphonaceae bacterium]|nr:hypothetical protein [Herpetosiphonaceae bacterium]
MQSDKLARRRQAYFKLSSAIALIDNAQLRALLESGGAASSWSHNQTVDIARSKVFVKRLPLTDLEYEHMFSTSNVYDLPTYYNYGFGSAGLGVFRELVSHIKTSNWVLEGAIASFPLLYHYRVIPAAGPRAEPDQEKHARYVEYWGGNPNIGRYMLDRAGAGHELVLFLEHFPHTVAAWLLEHPKKVTQVLAEMQAAITFLRGKGIIHFDTHFFNMLSDGKQTYLADFGLALDKQFSLAPAEEAFFKQHSSYDHAYLLWNLGSHLFWIQDALDAADKQRLAEQLGLTEEMKFEEIIAVLLDNIDALAADPALKLDPAYVADIKRYRPVIDFMNTFYSKMRKNSRKDTRFQHTTLQRLLKDSGFIAGPNA